MMGIFQSNSIPIRECDKLKGKDLGTAVFRNICRINHSCKPNVVWSFNQAKKTKEVRATKTILAGEEVSACYIDPLSMAEDRQKMLSARFNFMCSCEICSLPPDHLKENDKLRREILGLNNNMEDVYDKNPQKALKYAKMKLERMEKIKDEMIEIFPQVLLYKLGNKLRVNTILFRPTWIALSFAWQRMKMKSLRYLHLKVKKLQNS